jgi:hypothetical protein
MTPSRSGDILVPETRRSTMERKPKKPVSGKAKVRIKDLKVKDPGKLKGGAGGATDRTWDLTKNTK